MSQPGDEFDEKMEVLGQFLEELQQSADAEAVVRRYGVAHPQWAKDFLEEAVMSRLLTTSRAEATFPDLSQLTDFKILRGIAAGGMGVVYEAEQLSLRRRVALKVRYGQSSPEREAAFEREQHVLARLHQSHIVPIYQSGRCGAWQYFAMAYIEGATLHHVLRAAAERVALGQPVPSLQHLVAEARRRDSQADDTARLAEYAGALAHRSTQHGTLNDTDRDTAPAQSAQAIRLPPSYFRSVATLVADAAEAVAHAHAAKVIHRDIKPSNVMVDLAGQCWLIDFGLAEVAQPNAEGPAKPGRPAGTPGYMAPEQLHAGAAPASELTDVWGLGVTLFEAVTLRRPSHGISPDEEMQPVRTLVPNAPADLAAICRKALQRNPAARYPTAQELARDLRRWLENRPTVARPVPPWRAVGLWAGRNKGWAAALACSVVLLVACTIFLLVQTEHRAERAELRSRVAEAQASDEREKARLLERESWLQSVQQMQLGQPYGGWSARAWELVQRANEVHGDARVRDYAVATLRGLDAQLVELLPFGSSSVAFGPGGQSLAIGGFTDATGKAVRPAAVWSREPERLAESARAGEGPVAFDAQGNPVQLTWDKGELVLWNMAGQAPRWQVKLPSAKAGEESVALALSGDATWIAASAEIESGKPRTFLWQSTSERPRLECDFAAEAIAFTESGAFAALADNARHRIAIYSLTTRDLVAVLPTGSVPVLSLAFGKNPGRTDAPLSQFLLAAGDAGGTVGVWDLATRMPISFCRGSPREVFAVAFHPDGTLLATGGREEVQLWEVASGKPRLRVRPDIGIDYISHIAFSRTGEHLAVASRGVFYSPSTTVWRLSNRRGLCGLRGLSGQIETIVVSPDGKNLAALAQNWQLGVWDLDTGHLQYVREVPAGSFADNAGLAFSSDSRSLAYSVSTPTRGTAVLLDTTTGTELRRWALPPGLQNRFGSADAQHLWHFQVEIESGKALPTSNVPWREHPRVGRIRNLLAEGHATPAEVRDFPRYIIHAEITPDGRFAVVKGSGELSAVVIVETQTGKVRASHRTQRTLNSSNLMIDATGAWAAFSHSDADTTTQLSIPDGNILEIPVHPPLAANARSGFSCRRAYERDLGCFLFRSPGDEALANLALGVTINTAAFDPSGRRLIWGGRDGSVVVCELDVVLERLKALPGRP